MGTSYQGAPKGGAPAIFEQMIANFSLFAIPFSFLFINFAPKLQFYI